MNYVVALLKSRGLSLVRFTPGLQDPVYGDLKADGVLERIRAG
jgi:hypothetical protein